MTSQETAAAVLTAVSHLDYHTAERLLLETRSPAEVALLLGIVAAGSIKSTGVSLELALPEVCASILAAELEEPIA